MLFLVVAVSLTLADMRACPCCEVPTLGCSPFIDEYTNLQRCVAEFSPDLFPAPNWFYLPPREGAEGDCDSPMGSGTDVRKEKLCECLYTFADSLAKYNCTDEILKMYDYGCKKLGCSQCSFVTPQCHSVARQRCHVEYQTAVNQNSNGSENLKSQAVVCPALTAKMDCYHANNCDFAGTGDYQQTIQQCRKQGCSACYEPLVGVKNGVPALVSLLVLAILLVF